MTYNCFQVQCEHSELPYYEYVNPDPTEEEMRTLVCNKVNRKWMFAHFTFRPISASKPTVKPLLRFKMNL